jgi:putative transposase
MIGAARYEHSGDRLTERNGHRSKTLATKGGDVEIAIPKLRKGSYFPSFSYGTACQAPESPA